MPDSVGFIGLGLMGRPMARNLIDAGYRLIVHNRSRAAVDELAERGAEPAGTPREVAEKSSIVITMLPGSGDVEQVVSGDNGILLGTHCESLIVDMTTVYPKAAQKLSAEAESRNVSMLDAPVSGGVPAAVEGSLSIMVGGSEAAFARVRPLFEVLGTTIEHVGDSGAGQVVKACNQIVVALTIEAVSEALVLGSKAGVDPATTLKVLSGGLAGNKVMEVRGRNFLEHDFDPGGKVEFHHRDLQIALATGREYDVPLPVTAIVTEMFGVLKSRGQGRQDHSAMLTLIEDWAQHTIGSASRG